MGQYYKLVLEALCEMTGASQEAPFQDLPDEFKQKTAYEIMPSLVGSEMCIRDRMSSPGSQKASVPSPWQAEQAPK